MRMRMEVQEVGAMNSNDSHDILPIASSITRFKKIVQTMREDLIISGGVQQTNTNSNDDDELHPVTTMIVIVTRMKMWELP